MCTTTYVPLADTKAFVPTHSRDEKAVRPVAHLPARHRLTAKRSRFRKTRRSKELGLPLPKPVVCHGRGIVVLDFFECANSGAFADWYDFSNLEPFTLLIAGRRRLVEIRWNGKRVFFHEKDPKRPHIWSSVTLYAPDIVKKREGWFRGSGPN